MKGGRSTTTLTQRRLSEMEMLTSSGNCAQTGDCFSNIGSPKYGDNERCSWIANNLNGELVFSMFDIMAYDCLNDYLTISGTQYCGSTAPESLQIASGDVIDWQSTGYASFHGTGFSACIRYCTSDCGPGSGCAFDDPSTKETMSCQTCPANSYSDATDTKACTHCGGGTTIGTGSTIVSECNCNVGYYLGPQSCLICPRGYATVESGSTSISACDICPGSTYEQFDGSIWCPFALPKFSVLYPSTPRGGTLLVTGGVFSQSEVFVIDKPLTVICQESEDCIFDGLYTHLVLRLNRVGSEGVTLEGITIKGGNPDYGDNGGGIYVFETTTIFRRCTIRDNSANLGGGIFAHQSEVFLLGVVFQNNTAFSENSRSSDFYVGTSSIVHVQSGCSEGESATWADDLDINIPPVGIAKSAAAVNHCTPCVGESKGERKCISAMLSVNFMF